MADTFLEVSREYCIFCDERLRCDPSGLTICPEHGVLDGISDEEWAELEKERNG